MAIKYLQNCISDLILNHDQKNISNLKHLIDFLSFKYSYILVWLYDRILLQMTTKFDFIKLLQFNEWISILVFLDGNDDTWFWLNGCLTDALNQIKAKHDSS